MQGWAQKKPHSPLVFGFEGAQLLDTAFALQAMTATKIANTNLQQSAPALKEVFARNVAAALRKRGLTVNAEVVRQAKRLGFEIQASTVTRAKEGNHSPTLDTVEILAKVTGFDPWQLLTVSFDPSNPPILREITEAEKEFYRRFFAGSP